MATKIIDVLSGKDARDFVSIVNVDYKDIAMKDTIFKAKPDDFLLITKTIGSKITINDVKLIDDALIDSLLR